MNTSVGSAPDVSSSAGPPPLTKRSQSIWVVLLVAAAATLIRWLFDAELTNLPFLLYIPVLLIAGWLGGLRLGLLATLLCLIVGWVCFVEPHSMLIKGSAPDLTRALLFAVAGAVISIVSGFAARSRQEARWSKQRYQFLAEALPQFVWTMNQRGVITYVNQHWCSYTGLTLHHAQNGSWLEMVHPDDRLKFESVYSGSAPRQSFEIEMRVRRASDGAYRWQLVRGWHVPGYDNDTHWIATAVDIDDREKAEEALRQGEEKFRGMVEAAAEGIWIVDTSSSTTFVNTQMACLLGYEAAEMLGRSCFDFIHPEERTRGLEGFRKRKADGDRDMREYRFIRKDGSVRWFSIVGSPLVDASGATTGILALCTDTTERHQTEARIRHLNAELTSKVSELETLLALAPVGIGFSYNVESRSAVLNNEAKRILGLQAGREADTSVLEFRSLPYRVMRNGVDVPRDELPMELAVRSRQPVLAAEYDILRQDGQLIQVICWASPLLDEKGEPRGSVAAFMDISQRKNMEMALRRANSALEQFAYAAAHDLQEPARTVTLYTQLLARNYKGRFDSQADELLKVTAEGSRRMETLIRDLLAYTQATDDKSEGHSVADVDQAITEVISNLAIRIEMLQASILRRDLPGHVGIRHTQLVQLLQNLISNALKYRGEESPSIEISAKRSTGCWEFSVRDNGPGIPALYQEQIFRVFNRLHGREIPGTGIGLAICQRIVAHYGGRIWVESEPGNGADFRFTLPEARPVA